VYLNLLGVLTGSSLTIIGGILTIKAFNYYKELHEPGKSLARTFLVSTLLFTIGSIAVIADSLTAIQLWGIEAICYTLSYLHVVLSVIYYLRILKSESQKIKIGNLSKKERKATLPISGVYVFKKPPTPKRLAFLVRHSNGLLAISRTQKELWARKYQIKPDKFVWLSRIETNDSTDPSKLHVLQDIILRFLQEKGGKAVVYFEGIEYLILYNDFTSVAKFLFSIKDYIISTNSLLILYLSSNILEQPQESILLKEFEQKSEEDLTREIYEKLLVSAIEGEKDAGSESKKE